MKQLQYHMNLTATNRRKKKIVEGGYLIISITHSDRLYKTQNPQNLVDLCPCAVRMMHLLKSYAYYEIWI